ncbi:MAG TPA: helix-turn-helix transcriptional regulator [Flavobacterium sp.]|jgi:transcriptional regulator with XRE-family HTH domain
MKNLLKNGRNAKGLTTREVAIKLKIDQALISKFESGTRNPTHAQLLQIGELYELDVNELELLWLTDRIIHTVKGYGFALEAIKAAEKKLSGETAQAEPQLTAASIQKLMDDMESLKSILSGKKI